MSDTEHGLSRNFHGYCTCGLKLNEHPGRWNFFAGAESQYEEPVTLSE